MGGERVSDEEILFRRIPPGSAWFEPPDRMSSFNFKLKPGEAGLSVYRARIVTGPRVLQKPHTVPGSVLAWATAGEVRALRNAGGEPLHLDIVAIADEDDPGHAEIRGPKLGGWSASVAKALRKVFQVTVVPETA